MFCAEAGDDAKTDEHDHPGVAFVLVDAFVAEEADNQGAEADDEDGDAGGEVAVADVVEDVSAGDGVYHCPAELVEEVDEGEEFGGPPAWGRLVISLFLRVKHLVMERRTE